MKNQFDNFLNTASKLRDGALVTAAFLYFFGYIVWAINASVNNLGLLPALDFQYFVAGIVYILGRTISQDSTGIWWRFTILCLPRYRKVTIIEANT